MKSGSLEKIEAFRRQELKNLLAQCTVEQRILFKRMYSHTNLEKDINSVVDVMPDAKINWAIQQCENTVKQASNKG